MAIVSVPFKESALVEPGSERKSFSRIAEVLAIPNLVKIQLDSFRWFMEEGLRELLGEISPIQDFTGKNLELHFLDYEFGKAKFDEAECRERDMTYSVPLRVKVHLVAKESGDIKEQIVFMGDFPLMTERGTFVINGAERVVVSQLVRSPGVYFTIEDDITTGRPLCYAKLIPNRGAWLEFETSNKAILSVKVDRKRKIPVTTLLRAVGYDNEEQLVGLFRDVDTGDHRYIEETISKDPSKTTADAILEVYRRLRPGDPPRPDSARSLINSLFFNYRRYDLGKVGRYKVNTRLNLTEKIQLDQRVLTKEDLVEIVKTMIQINNGRGDVDDIDHLGNRRVRSVGELIQNQFRIGLLRMERVIKERMSIQDPESATPAALVNIRPVVASVKEFFGGSQLSQFMDQTNPLAELTHKRRLSALGPGGLNRERAGMEVRDVHHSHYGRICPIETPEGPNIGLIGSLATYGIINQYGFIETPYRRVYSSLETNDPRLLNRELREDVLDGDDGQAVAKVGATVTPELVQKLAKLPARRVRLRPFVSDDIIYLTAGEEDKYFVAQANSGIDENDNFVQDRVEVRYAQHFSIESPDKVQYMDVSPKQIVSVAAALIPFLENDDANRALMGANMQRQAVPLIRAETPIVGTGMEWLVARDSGQVALARVDGDVVSVEANAITVQDAHGDRHVYHMHKFLRSNQGTCISQRPIVNLGDKVRVGQPLADSSTTQKGELALGQNVLVAFMSWEGYNYEDAIIISETLVREDKFTSIHIEKHEVEARSTKLGPEEITRDIPNVGEDALRDLDERGIIRVGAEVGPMDILVGKITPKGETELSAEERLLRAIFGEKAREVKDTSLRVPHGERGTVVDVKIFRREDRDELPAGVNEMVRVSMAQKRRVSVGDKMAGRHGNKGVIAKILPPEDMPFLPDGTHVDIILNPIGVPSRMNVGQILETHLGWAADALGMHVMTPVFDGAKEPDIEDALARAWLTSRLRRPVEGNSQEEIDARRTRAIDWLNGQGFDGPRVFDRQYVGEAKRVCLRLWVKDMGVTVDGLSDTEVFERAERVAHEFRTATPLSGKTTLRDGRTGDRFDNAVTVGQIYMLKLIHLVEDKVHARSTGPYSLITQQPLGGKAQFGGQRFGEMEVWALEAYGAAHTLQEILTIKSDDVVGRVKTYEAIVKGEDIIEPGVPESFKVLVKELQSLGLSIEVLNEEHESILLGEDVSGGHEDLRGGLEGIDLGGFER